MDEFRGETMKVALGSLKALRLPHSVDWLSEFQRLAKKRKRLVEATKKHKRSEEGKKA